MTVDTVYVIRKLQIYTRQRFSAVHLTIKILINVIHIPPPPPLVTPLIGAFYFCSSKSNRFLTGILEGSVPLSDMYTKLLAVIYFGKSNHTDCNISYTFVTVCMLFYCF